MKLTYTRNLRGTRPRRVRRKGVARLFVLGAAFAASTAVGAPFTEPMHAQTVQEGTAQRLSPRSLLFDMDFAIQRLGAENPLHPPVVSLTGVYHNLLREWAQS